MLRAHLYISGLVQGVFFRYNTRKQAERLGLSGWVKNLCDGKVEIIFEGDDDAVLDMVRWCEHGPTGARVAKVEQKIEKIDEVQEKGFEIRF